MINFKLTQEVPNKYNLTRKSLKHLKIKDWDRLKQKCWLNQAKAKDKGAPWYCHNEGCELLGKSYNDTSEFWIGFGANGDIIDFKFYCMEGMCFYNFKEFYNPLEIENKWDLQVQVNALRWINTMIDEGILSL